jgi:hypothetical protein
MHEYRLDRLDIDRFPPGRGVKLGGRDEMRSGKKEGRKERITGKDQESRILNALPATACATLV